MNESDDISITYKIKFKRDKIYSVNNLKVKIEGSIFNEEGRQKKIFEEIKRMKKRNEQKIEKKFKRGQKNSLIKK